MANESKLAIDHALPADVAVAGSRGWSGYRRYPVFSWPWLVGRTRLFAIGVGTVALLIAFGHGLADHDYARGARAGLYFFAGFVAIATMGPAMATWVRHRRWPWRRERNAVIAALVLGLGASALADGWTSRRIQTELEASVRVREEIANARKTSEAEQRVGQALGLLLGGTIYALLGGWLALPGYFAQRRQLDENRRQRELDAARLRERDAEQRLALLQAQVEPHFLFNALASIRALVGPSPRRAEDALDALVTYLRSTIPVLRQGDNAAFSTLGRQVDLCAAYLELMRVRLGERLGFSIDVPDALRLKAFPPLLLISLVENAVKHGVEPQPGPGRVTVQASASDGRLVVRVIDDGAGLRAGAGGGVGLANVREQLALRYGERAALSLAGLHERGAVAEIAVPLDEAA